MAEVHVTLDRYICAGKAACVGGKHPEPPLDKWPLLAWCPQHGVHGSKVFTEDGAAAVEAIALAACETPSYDALAARFHTTPGHVAQAIDYALAAGFLGQGN